MDFCFNYEHSNCLRQAFRLDHPALQIKLSGESVIYNVKNISVTGIAFYAYFDNVDFGDILSLNVLVADKTVFAEMKAEVLYVDKENNLTACAFKDLSSAHLSKLDLLMLHLQKHEIKKQKQIAPLSNKQQ